MITKTKNEKPSVQQYITEITADLTIPYPTMPNKNLFKTIKLVLFSGLFYAGGLALFVFGDRVDFRLGKFIFNFLFFANSMGWMLSHPKKET